MEDLEEIELEFDEDENNQEYKSIFDDKLDEINKLNKKIKSLESCYNNLSKNFDIVVKDNDILRQHILYQNSIIKSYERELERYRNKEKKRKRKKYTVSDLLELRQKGYSYKKIAKMYGVSASTIHYRINK